MMFPILCTIACMAVCLPLSYTLKKRCRSAAIFFKALGTVCAALIALGGAVAHGGAAWLCVAALLLCAAADAALEIRFLSGMMLFAAGHVCYCLWYLHLGPVGVTHLLIFLMLLGLAITLLMLWRKSLGRWLIPFSAYSVVLCLMGALSAGTGLILGQLSGLLLMLGGLMFVFSDVMVCRNLTHPTPLWLDVVSMAIYYGAQLLLGISCTLM